MPKLTDLTVKFISLVERPATGKGLTLKAQGTPSLFDLIKTDGERMIAYGIVYAPDQMDSHGDFTDADTIRKAAYNFMEAKRLDGVDEEHNFKKSDAFVAESWIVRAGDALFPDEQQGAWAVGIQIKSAPLWQKLKSGDYTGLSLAGTAKLEDQTKSDDAADADAPSWFKNFIKTLTPNQNMKEKSMNEAEVKALIQAELQKAAHAPTDEQNPAQSAPADHANQPAALTKADLDAALKAQRDEIQKEIAIALQKGASETTTETQTSQGSFV